jgi:hypothetical protein
VAHTPALERHPRHPVVPFEAHYRVFFYLFVLLRRKPNRVATASFFARRAAHNTTEKGRMYSWSRRASVCGVCVGSQDRAASWQSKHSVVSSWPA